MKRMPRTVEVGPHTYKVARKKLPNGDLGRCSYDDQTIGIRPLLKPSKRQEIVLHEVLHACGYPTLCGKDEEFVDTIAPVLLQVLRANPALVEYLTK